jgi:6-phosphogluconolactonase (cycloisomerase 2 family)
MQGEIDAHSQDERRGGVAAIQERDLLAVFRIDERDGRLIDTGGRVEVGSPVCVKFVAVAGGPVPIGLR